MKNWFQMATEWELLGPLLGILRGPDREYGVQTPKATEYQLQKSQMYPHHQVYVF